MNQIPKRPISSLGYGFIPDEYIPKGKDEYYLRNIQNRREKPYRKLTRAETRLLVSNGNSSDNWNNVLVSEAFTASLVKNCKFYGLVRIGKLEPFFLEFNNLRMPVGLYNSTIISSDIGDNVVIDNVNFMSHYVVGNDAILVNINELATTSHSKFGNGIIKEGEKEAVRIWIEVCNENAGRAILPFNGMLPGDAWLWSKYRDDDKLMDRFREFTEAQFDKKRGYYGKIGDRTVIKNCRIIKDAWIGSDAYIKGANKLKNITINSSPEAKSQIGEGCELVNGIIGFGCRVFYGVKAVRFIMGSHSQLKYGARLINSYLGDNSTISCCEVLNSLIFPAHEQHHNNSFLCASVVMGQSNMAAGATIGSNHNSRGADGEMVAGRGFWPGLCVSLKHNSKFASFTIIAKGDFPAELNIPVPFSLVSNNVSDDTLVVMPGYWFLYNMYALARNAGKYNSRDHRVDKTQHLEYDYLAPDSVNELMDALTLLEKTTAKAWAAKNKKQLSEKQLLKKGKELLTDPAVSIDDLELRVEGFENSNRKACLVKVKEAYTVFNQLIVYYGITNLLRLTTEKKIGSFKKLAEALPSGTARDKWLNIGGQLMEEKAVKALVKSIHGGKIKSWDEVHAFYKKQSDHYTTAKTAHAWACMLQLLELDAASLTPKKFAGLLDQALATQQWMAEGIYSSREKDYKNPFRKMVYETEKEMEKVIGKLADNSFIKQTEKELAAFTQQIKDVKKAFKL